MIPEVAPEDVQMFVATVPDKIHGAGVITYPNFMEDAAQKMGGDFFVLPSSIHEVLLVKDNGHIQKMTLRRFLPVRWNMLSTIMKKSKSSQRLTSEKGRS